MADFKDLLEINRGSNLKFYSTYIGTNLHKLSLYRVLWALFAAVLSFTRLSFLESFQYALDIRIKKYIYIFLFNTRTFIIITGITNVDPEAYYILVIYILRQ